MFNDCNPTSFTASTPLKGWPRSSPPADQKEGCDTVEDRLADSAVAKTAARIESKENRATAPGALGKRQISVGISSRGTTAAFCKGATPPRPLKSKAPLMAARHCKSNRTGTSTQDRQLSLHASSTPLSFSPFRSVKGQAQGQLKSDTAPTLAAAATTWINPMFAYPCEPPSSLKFAPRPIFALPEVTEAQAHSQAEADSQRISNAPPSGPSRPDAAASTPTIRMHSSGRTPVNARLSFGHGAGLPTADEPADAPKYSTDATERPPLASGAAAPTEPSSPSGNTCGTAAQAQGLDQGPLPADAPVADSPRLVLGAVARWAESPVPHQDTDDISCIRHTADEAQLEAAAVVPDVAEVALAAAKTTALHDAIASTAPVHQALAAAQQQQSPPAAVSMGVGSGDSPLLGSGDSLNPNSQDSPMPASPSAASEAPDVSYAELDAALELGFADSPIPSAGVLMSEESPLLGSGDSLTLDSGDSPMQASPSAGSEASDASYAELDAALESGFADSPIPSAGVLESVDLCECLQQMPSVIFGTLCAAPADEQRQGLTSSSSRAHLEDVNIESPCHRMYSPTLGADTDLPVTPGPSGVMYPAYTCQDELMTSADDSIAWDAAATAVGSSYEERAQQAVEHDRASHLLPLLMTSC